MLHAIAPSCEVFRRCWVCQSRFTTNLPLSDGWFGIQLWVRLITGNSFRLSRTNLTRSIAFAQFLSRRPHCETIPTVLCPSAYVNVSRAVAQHAASCPQKIFYLVLARRSARITPLPSNVRVASLDGYFVPSNRDELHTLAKQWEELRERLVSSSEEFLMADRAGVLGRFPSLLRWQ